MVKVDLSGASDFFVDGGPDYAAAAEAHRVLAGRTGAGSDFTGWLDLPVRMRDGELKSIVAVGEALGNNKYAPEAFSIPRFLAGPAP